MKTRIQKCGNSLALRIPTPFAAEVGLEPDSPVDVSVAKGKLIVEPAAEAPLPLRQL
jgi:antitoxin MazE